MTNAETLPKMTYEEAKARIPDRVLPAFWFGQFEGLASRFERLSRGDVKAIAISPGGRPIHRVAYGEKEEVARLANYNSAIGAREPSAFADKDAREKPVIFFLGPVHGQEVEGLTGLANLIEVMETGRDLRGKDQPALRELGDACRLLIVPAGNPDGLARFEPRALQGMEFHDIKFWGQGTWSDGHLCGWPGCKRRHPLRPEDVQFLGCYFNDAGVNPMHDDVFDPMGPEAPAFLRLAREEAADLAVSLHSHRHTPDVLIPDYVPDVTLAGVTALSERLYSMLGERGLPSGRSMEEQARQHAGKVKPFKLCNAIHHICGAAAFTFECPHGIVNDERACQAGLEEILDIQLTLYEAMMRHALEAKGR